MTEGNGQGPKRAITYYRVSGDNQRDHGYSLDDQKRELRQWCAQNSYEIALEEEDGAWSGGFLERPGLDRVRERVAAGGIDAVVVLFRDRIARGFEAQLLAEEFREYGCRLIALNAQVDDSPDGELHGGMLDLIAGWQRKKIAQLTSRGRLEKARQGKIVAAQARPAYGFRFNETRDGYVVDEETMPVVRRIDRMLADGESIHAVKRALEAEGVPAPQGGSRWSRRTICQIVKSDLYLPHTVRELEGLGVAPEVLARLDPAESYGVSWWGKRRTKIRPVVENGPEGREYRKRQNATKRDRSEWVAIPVPGSGIAREVVERARDAIKDNRSPSSSGDRFWELSGGVFYCGECGKRMAMDRRRRNNDATKFYNYYRCATRQHEGIHACPHAKNHRAEQIEVEVWEAVREALRDPSRVAEAYDRAIQQEREKMRGDPERERRRLLDALERLEITRDRYLDQQAEGLIGMEKLRQKLSGLDAQKEALERELAATSDRGKRIEQLERDKEAVIVYALKPWRSTMNLLTPEEKNALYRRYGVKVIAQPDGSIEITGLLWDGCVDEDYTSRYDRPAGATCLASGAGAGAPSLYAPRRPRP